MSPRVACLILTLAGVVSAMDFFSYVEPGDTIDSPGHLELFARISKPRRGYVKEMAMYTSQPGETEMSHLMARVDSEGAVIGPEGDKYTTLAYLKDTFFGDTIIQTTWNNECDGFGRFYKLNATYVTASGNEQVFTETEEVKPREVSGCVKIPEEIKLAFPNATEEQWKQVLNKIESIDSSTYDVSTIYSGRVYTASNKDKNFKLHKMNELCKNAAPRGYLVELDSPEEQYFVRDFLKAIGSYDYYTGANDVNSARNFVFYNSGKPVTNVVWQRGEPNNQGGVEDCVEINRNGLNDNQCQRQKGYICEIPLL